MRKNALQPGKLQRSWAVAVGAEFPAEVATGVLEGILAVPARLPEKHMMTHLMEVAVGLVAAGLTTMMGFFATKLVIEGMARKLHG